MDALYDIFKDEELGVAQRIQQRRLQMIVHSCIYYVYDENLVSDAQWAAWGRELQALQEQYPNISRLVPFYEYFTNWDASTGINLPIHEPWVKQRAEELIERRRK